MATGSKTRAESFFLVVCWVTIIAGAVAIGLAVNKFVQSGADMTFLDGMRAVFIGLIGIVGIVAGFMGLFSRQMKRCRIMGLILFVLSAMPLIVDLAGKKVFSQYWYEMLYVVLPLMYLIGSLLKRSPKKPVAAPAPASVPAAPTAEEPKKS